LSVCIDAWEGEGGRFIRYTKVAGRSLNCKSNCSEGVGVDLAELLEVQHFAEAGVHSLTSLTITGRARKDLDMDIPSSFFVDYPTVDQARLAIASLMGSGDQTRATTPYSVSDDAKSSPSSLTGSSVLDSIAKPDYDLEVQDISQSTRPSTSIVLQGSLKTA
jgi:hypothetical protein